MADTKATSEPGALEQFLVASENFLGSTLDTIAKSIGAHADAPLIISHSGAAREQLGKLTRFVRAQYTSGSVDLRRQIDEFMQTQSVTTLARDGQKTFQEVAAKGLFGGGIFSWIETVMHEIKKLIEWLASQFHWPDWIVKLLQVLDQILMAILGLFGGAVGQSQSKIMSQLSAMEVDFWNEIAAHKRYASVGAVSATEEE